MLVHQVLFGANFLIFPWRKERLSTPVFWPGEFHGLYRPRGCKESDTTERLSLHFTSHFLHVNLCSNLGTCLVVQRLRLCFRCWDVSLIPGGGTRIPHAAGSDQKKKKKKKKLVLTTLLRKQCTMCSLPMELLISSPCFTFYYHLLIHCLFSLKFVYSFLLGCAGSSLLRVGFL